MRKKRKIEDSFSYTANCPIDDMEHHVLAAAPTNVRKIELENSGELDWRSTLIWLQDFKEVEKLTIKGWNGPLYAIFLVLPKLRTLKLPDCTLNPYGFAFSKSLRYVYLKKMRIKFIDESV